MDEDNEITTERQEPHLAEESSETYEFGWGINDSNEEAYQRWYLSQQ